ncbi:MAG: 16S rRNA (uracil(1498)-N(3))-methyltransferase [Pseudomonadota bacterium]
MPRFYCPQALAAGAVIELPDAVAHHVHVVRLQPGAELCLFNGEGGEYVARLLSVEKRRATAEILAFVTRDVELPYQLTLAQALPESAKMDWIVEKAVELGVSSVVPLAAQRCVVRLSAERAQKRHSHWQGIIASATEQCGRTRLARLAPLEDFSSWVAQQDMHKRILFTPRAKQTLAGWARHQPPQPLTIMIGPEGGFSQQEEDIAINQGALALSLGARVLRTETAGLAALAGLNAIWTPA